MQVDWEALYLEFYTICQKIDVDIDSALVELLDFGEKLKLTEVSERDWDGAQRLLSLYNEQIPDLVERKTKAGQQLASFNKNNKNLQLYKK
jgi:hypothetical protein